MSKPPENPPVAVAAEIHANPTTSRWRMSFYPRAPGPRLAIFAMILGICPSVFVSWFFLSSGVDGGYYRWDASILRTHSLLFSIAGVLMLTTFACLCFVLLAMWSEHRARVARGVMALALAATIGWDWWAVQWVRPQLMPIMTRGDVIAFADTALPEQELGLQAMSYEARVMRFDFGVPQDMSVEKLPQDRVYHVLCTNLGALFAGPVDVLDLRLIRPDDTTIEIRMPRGDCRAWYLQTRSPNRRPRTLGPADEKFLEVFW